MLPTSRTIQLNTSQENKANNKSIKLINNYIIQNSLSFNQIIDKAKVNKIIKEDLKHIKRNIFMIKTLQSCSSSSKSLRK